MSEFIPKAYALFIINRKHSFRFRVFITMRIFLQFFCVAPHTHLEENYGDRSPKFNPSILRANFCTSVIGFRNIGENCLENFSFITKRLVLFISRNMHWALFSSIVIIFAVRKSSSCANNAIHFEVISMLNYMHILSLLYLSISVGILFRSFSDKHLHSWRHVVKCKYFAPLT